MTQQAVSSLYQAHDRLADVPLLLLLLHLLQCQLHHCVAQMCS
jgi:hypothetical protein